ncbi:MAG: DUF4381 domain-containing protein [Akkermansiaceae bacterium]|nr:DUF4381 domain-containing protein [Akkermansiaceae bacterium]
MTHFDGTSSPNRNSRHPHRRTAAAWLWTAALAAAQSPAPQPEEDIRPPRGLIEIPQPEPTSHTAWIVAAVVAGAMLAGWLLWRMWCRRRQTTRPETKALAELSQLSKVRESIPAGEFADRAAGTLRHYLTDRFGIAAPQRTTEEFLRVILTGDSPLRAHDQVLMAFLRSCDLAKFADRPLDSDQRHDLLDQARKFIFTTAAPEAGGTATPSTP